MTERSVQPGYANSENILSSRQIVSGIIMGGITMVQLNVKG